MFGEQTSCSSRSGYSSGSVPFSGVCSHLGGPLSRSSDVICGKPGGTRRARSWFDGLERAQEMAAPDDQALRPDEGAPDARRGEV